ncbi:MAG: efflux RND transporter periplasmic adaptor subunit, partial [Spirochaetota bacterium]
ARQELETARIEYTQNEKDLYRKFYQLEKLALQINNYQHEIEFLKDHLEKKRILYEKGGVSGEELGNAEFSLKSKHREMGILQKEYQLQSFGFRDQDLIEEGYEVPQDREKKRKLLIYINTALARKKIRFAEIHYKRTLVEQERLRWLGQFTTITSPIDGIVSRVAKYVGEKVDADEPVTTILSENRLLARVSFSESDLQKLHRGDEVSVYIDSMDYSLKGRIYTIDPYIDIKTRSFFVDCVVANTGVLKPGMFVRVIVPVKKERKYVLIPAESFLKENQNSAFVYVVARDDRIFKKAIRYEKFNDRMVIVTRGLHENAVILREPIMGLADGMRITPREGSTSAQSGEEGV